MAKKELVITEVENLFQNSSRKSMSTKCDMGFRFLERKNLKLCNEWVESVDGVFKITFYDDFIIPETIPINGESYRVTEIGEFTIGRIQVTNATFWVRLRFNSGAKLAKKYSIGVR